MPEEIVNGYDQREEKLAINMMSEIPLSSPEAIPIDEMSPPIWDEPSTIREVYDRFFPILLSTGIFEKTPIIKFHVLIVFVEPHRECHDAKHRCGKSRIHSYSKTFHWSELPKESKEELQFFCLKLMAEGLLDVCVKRNLDKSKILTLLKELQVEVDEDKEVIIDENQTEEIRVNIKLEAEFGNADELIRNTQIIESIAYHLEERGVGWFDGSENGGGFETIFCCGPSAEEMKKVLLEIFDGVKLPKGSYFEFDDGEKEELPN